jgi:hypothetical protein
MSESGGYHRTTGPAGQFEVEPVVEVGEEPAGATVGLEDDLLTNGPGMAGGAWVDEPPSWSGGRR